MKTQTIYAAKRCGFRHMGIGIGVFEDMDNKTLRECFTQDDKEAPTAKQIRSELKEMRDKGLRYFPNCDNTDDLGQCKGHEDQ